MKKILVVFLSFLIFSCENDVSLDPRPDRIPGQFVYLDIINSKIDANNIATSAFEGVLSVPANNVDKYELFVARRDAKGFVSDYVLLETITTFPFNLKVNNSKIMAVGLPSLVNSDILRFYGRSYKNGNVADFNSLAGILRTSVAQKQAYRFKTEVTDLDLDKPIENQYTW